MIARKDTPTGSQRPDPTLDEKEYYLDLMTRFLQHAFSSLPPTNMFYWHPDEETTKIVINASPPLNPSVVARYPAVVVCLGPVSTIQMGINDFSHRQFSTGTDTFLKMRQAYFTIYAIAKSPHVAGNLSNKIQIMIEAERALLESPGGFHHIARAPGISENEPSAPGQMVPGDPNGPTMIQVNVPALWQRGYSVTPARLPERTLADILDHPSERNIPSVPRNDLHTIRVRLDRAPERVGIVRGGLPSTVEIVSGRRGIADLVIAPQPKEM